jgi:hypothetical protein
VPGPGSSVVFGDEPRPSVSVVAHHELVHGVDRVPIRVEAEAERLHARRVDRLGDKTAARLRQNAEDTGV